jgi:hypothetical protein
MPAKKRKTWPGRVYLGRDDSGRQQFWWVGRFATKRERDDAVARARTQRPWETAPAPDEMTCEQWADRFLARMESGALRTKSGRRFKDSSIDTAHGSLKAFRAEFGDRTPGSNASGGRGLGRARAPVQAADRDHADERALPRRGDRPQPLRGPQPTQRRPQERAASERGGDGASARRLLGFGPTGTRR